jgi:hypothetical protein
MHNKNFKKNEKHVRLCKVRIEKECEHKKSRKKKLALFSFECSISFGENLNSHMLFPILPYPFQKNSAKLCIFANLLGQL